MSLTLIEQYENGGHRLRMAVNGLTDADLRATPVPGKWSTHRVVIHLCDAETAFADRIRRIIATDDAALLAWDHDRFAAALRYEDQSVEDAILIVEATRRQLARVLKQLPAEVLDRSGNHSERGPQTVRDILTKADDHLTHHLHFIAEKREKMGKLMW